MMEGMGGNITIPFKERAYRLLDWVDTRADRMGAINVFKSTVDGLCGWNSDCLAIQELLRNVNCDQTVIFGCGGAARAAVSAVLDLFPSASVTVVSRNPACAWFTAQVKTVGWSDRAHALKSATLVINATPLGFSNIGNPIPETSVLSTHMTVLDMVYRPIMTPLLRMAQEQEAHIITGIDMLLHQARESFQIWFGETPIIEEALRESLMHP